MADRDALPRNPDTDYERSDVPLAPLGWIALFLLVWLAGIPLLLTVGYPQAMSDAFKRLTAQPPAPRLQTDERGDLIALRQKIEAQLNSYGWVDKAHGIVHVPIDRAIVKLAHDGIPDWPQAKQ